MRLNCRREYDMFVSKRVRTGHALCTHRVQRQVGKQSNEQGAKSGPFLARSNKAMDFEQIQSYNEELTRKQTT